MHMYSIFYMYSTCNIYCTCTCTVYFTCTVHVYSTCKIYCTCTCTVHVKYTVHVQYILHVHVHVKYTVHVQYIYFPLLFRFIGEIEKISEKEGVTVFEKKVVRTGEKRKREDKGTPDDIDGYKGKELQI